MHSKRFVTAGVAVVLLATGASATPALADGDPDGCPEGFNLGTQTFQQRLDSPKIQAAIAAGLLTVGEAEASFALIDANGNGLVCVQDILARTENAAFPQWAYADNVRDDDVAGRA